VKVVGVVTVGRSDYSIYLPILRRLQDDPELRLRLIVAGMHLAPEFGLTVREIEQDGFEVAERIEMLLSSDTPEGIGKSLGLGVIGFAQAYARSRPDILLALGDRFEMLAAVEAALPFRVPVAHVHGGELTAGAIDDAMRHAITKMSHLHFVATATYAARVVQMGEEPWRVIVAGAPSLDNLRHMSLLSPAELERQHGIPAGRSFVLATYHPVTLEVERTEAQMRALLGALEAVDLDIVFTYPNADTSGRLIIRMLEEFAARCRRARVVASFGPRVYFSLMNAAAAMVGNSSSGIVEAASFKLPVVNIGRRQEGRLRPPNVIDVGDTREEIAAGIAKARSAEFAAGLAELVNPYGDGHASERIVDTLRRVRVDDALLVKRFYDIGGDPR